MEYVSILMEVFIYKKNKKIKTLATGYKTKLVVVLRIKSLDKKITVEMPFPYESFGNLLLRLKKKSDF